MYKIVLSLLSIILFLPDTARSQALACPPNIDFELGTFANWEYATGTCCPISLSAPAPPVAGRHLVTSGAGTDPVGGFPIVCPAAGFFSFKLGNNGTGREAENMKYYLRVPGGSKKYSIIFRYAVVFQDPGHNPADQPRFEVRAYDSATNDAVACANYSFIASSSLPGFVGSGGAVYKPWTMASIDLSGMNGKTVVLDFATGDCNLGGHYGYAYVDINCQLFQTYSLTCLGNKSSLAGPPGYQTYQWWDSTFTKFYGNGQNLLVPTPPVKTTFAVVVNPYPGFGCPDTLYTVTNVSDLKIKAGPDTTICDDGATKVVPLTVTGSSSISALNYTWGPPASGLSCTNCSNPFVSVNTYAKFYVTGKDSSGCEIADTVEIKNAYKVFAKLKAAKDTICQYEEMEVVNDIANVPVTTYYLWSLDTGKAKKDDGNGKISVAWNTPGYKKIKLQVTNLTCDGWDSVYVYVKPTPIGAYDMKKNGCLGEVITLTPKEADAWYYWKLDGHVIKDTVYKKEYNLTWNSLGRKNVIMTVKGKNGCNPEVTEGSIFIHENPETNIEFASKERICFGDKVLLTVPKGDAFEYNWEPAVFFENNNYHEVTLRAELAMMVSATVTNRWGCNVVDSAFVNATLCCKLFCPDAFTPNGDGSNDTYGVKNLEYQKLHTFNIMNRWGQIVFSTTDPTNKWDGKFKNEPQEMGTYYYYIKYLCEEKDQIEQKGSFTLIR